MSTALVSVDEYLNTSYKPACEYLDGVLKRKPMPTFDHALVQSRLVSLISAQQRSYIALPELTVKIREREWLVPDVAIMLRSQIQRPYALDPVFLCIEILSPDDRLAETFTKCEQYHLWGVAHCWVVDPEKKAAWIYEKGSAPKRATEEDTLWAGGIHVSMRKLFEAED
jgi:Uma2 family endonuclease